MENKKRNCSSHSLIKAPLCFDNFYLVSIQTDPQYPVWLENLIVNTAKSWQTFNGFLQIYHFILTLNALNVLTIFGAKYIQKTVSYLNIFTDFKLLSCISRNRFSVRANRLSSTHFLPQFDVLISHLKWVWMASVRELREV